MPGKPTIGWIGMGRMGYPMAERLLKAGYDVSIWNRTRAKAEFQNIDTNRDGFIERAEAEALVRQRLLLEEDVAVYVNGAEAQTLLQ